MAKPIQDYSWASSDVNLPNTSQPNKQEHSATLKSYGIDKGELFKAEEFNYWANSVEKHLDFIYLKSQIVTNDSELTSAITEVAAGTREVIYLAAGSTFSLDRTLSNLTLVGLQGDNPDFTGEITTSNCRITGCQFTHLTDTGSNFYRCIFTSSYATPINPVSFISFANSYIDRSFFGGVLQNYVEDTGVICNYETTIENSIFSHQADTVGCSIRVQGDHVNIKDNTWQLQFFNGSVIIEVVDCSMVHIINNTQNENQSWNTYGASTLVDKAFVEFSLACRRCVVHGNIFQPFISISSSSAASIKITDNICGPVTLGNLNADISIIGNTFQVSGKELQLKGTNIVFNNNTLIYETGGGIPVYPEITISECDWLVMSSNILHGKVVNITNTNTSNIRVIGNLVSSVVNNSTGTNIAVSGN